MEGAGEALAGWMPAGRDPPAAGGGHGAGWRPAQQHRPAAPRLGACANILLLWTPSPQPTHHHHLPLTNRSGRGQRHCRHRAGAGGGHLGAARPARHAAAGAGSACPCWLQSRACNAHSGVGRAAGALRLPEGAQRRNAGVGALSVCLCRLQIRGSAYSILSSPKAFKFFPCSSPTSTTTATFSRPLTPSLPSQQLADFNYDGYTDVILVSHDGLWGWAQVRPGGRTGGARTMGWGAGGTWVWVWLPAAAVSVCLCELQMGERRQRASMPQKKHTPQSNWRCVAAASSSRRCLFACVLALPARRPAGGCRCSLRTCLPQRVARPALHPHTCTLRPPSRPRAGAPPGRPALCLAGGGAHGHHGRRVCHAAGLHAGAAGCEGWHSTAAAAAAVFPGGTAAGLAVASACVGERRVGAEPRTFACGRGSERLGMRP